MINRGKSINLFLMDGESIGRIKCTLANWTGVAYKIPRTKLDECKGRDDLSQSGVYFLFGVSDQTGKNVVYIGQAGVRKNGEGLLYRLQEHKRNPNKDYWTEAVVFTTSNNSFGQTEISYLENRFCAIATEADRYTVKNGNDPNLGNITEEKESELEDFIDYAKVIMGILGHKVFEKLNENKKIEIKNDTSRQETKEDLLLLEKMSKTNGQLKAKCRQTSEGFVVLAGSRIGKKDYASGTVLPSVAGSRKQAKVDANGILQEDILFRSPSAAAMFVIGASANGLIEWKTAQGKTLKELQAEGEL